MNTEPFDTIQNLPNDPLRFKTVTGAKRNDVCCNISSTEQPWHLIRLVQNPVRKECNTSVRGNQTIIAKCVRMGLADTIKYVERPP